MLVLNQSLVTLLLFSIQQVEYSFDVHFRLCNVCFIYIYVHFFNSNIMPNSNLHQCLICNNYCVKISVGVVSIKLFYFSVCRNFFLDVFFWSFALPDYTNVQNLIKILFLVVYLFIQYSLQMVVVDLARNVNYILLS